MRLVNINDRLHLLTPDGAVDVETVSDGKWSADPQAALEDWDAFVNWATALTLPTSGRHFEPSELGSPVPRPRQVFAVGLNYQAHADESGFKAPEAPVIFTKFVSSISGPNTTVVLPRGRVDWEVELVVAIGRGGRNIPVDTALDHVAGVTIGQDISERERQHSGPAPQFSLAKSHAGFSPVGPELVTLDEVGDLADLGIGARINDETVQHGNTSQLIFSVPELIAHLSDVVELYPGDLIFTGTPAGVGAGRVPPRYLAPGEILTSWIEGLGEMQQTFVAGYDTPGQGTGDQRAPRSSAAAGASIAGDSEGR